MGLLCIYGQRTPSPTTPSASLQCLLLKSVSTINVPLTFLPLANGKQQNKKSTRGRERDRLSGMFPNTRNVQENAMAADGKQNRIEADRKRSKTFWTTTVTDWIVVSIRVCCALVGRLVDCRVTVTEIKPMHANRQTKQRRTNVLQ